MYQSFYLWAHSEDAVGRSVNGADQAVCESFFGHLSRCVHSFQNHFQIRVYRAVLKPNVTGERLDVLGKRTVLVGRHRQVCHRFTWNRVAQATSFNACQSYTVVLIGPVQQAVHDLVGVAQAFVDVHARMAPVESANGQAVTGKSRRGVFQIVGALGGHIYPAGTTDGEFVVVLGVEVEHDFGLQQSAFESHGTGHASFLVNGEQGLKPRVGNVGGRQQGHDGGHTNAIVSAQGGAVGAHPVVFHQHLNALSVEVELGIVVLLVHHVQVTLEDHSLAVFHAWSCGFVNDHIAHLIHNSFKSEGLAKVLGEGNHTLFFFGRTWHRVQVCKVVPEARGLELSYCLAHGYC